MLDNLCSLNQIDAYEFIGQECIYINCYMMLDKMDKPHLIFCPSKERLNCFRFLSYHKQQSIDIQLVSLWTVQREGFLQQYLFLKIIYFWLFS